jgi:hypothetical protein
VHLCFILFLCSMLSTVSKVTAQDEIRPRPPPRRHEILLPPPPVMSLPGSPLAHRPLCSFASPHSLVECNCLPGLHLSVGALEGMPRVWERQKCKWLIVTTVPATEGNTMRRSSRRSKANQKWAGPEWLNVLGCAESGLAHVSE